MNKKLVIAGFMLLLSGASAFAESDDPAAAQRGKRFNIRVTGATAHVTTNIANRTYPNAGIQILTPGFKVSGDVRPSNNGFYLFSVNDKSPANINIHGDGGAAQVQICLDAVGKKFSCENQTITSLANSHIIFMTSSTYGGNLGGIGGADAICQSVAYNGGSVVAVSGLQFKALLVAPERSPCYSPNGGATGGCGGSYAIDWPLVPGSAYSYPDGLTFFNTVNANGVFDGSNQVLKNELGYPTFQPFWSGIQSVLTNTSSTDISGWAYSDMNSAADSSPYEVYLATCQSFTSSNQLYSGSTGLNGQNSEVAGTITGSTWGNYYYFNNAQLSYIYNLFVSGNLSSCNQQLPIVCVS
jgi:hypothetical protein